MGFEPIIVERKGREVDVREIMSAHCEQRYIEDLDDGERNGT